MAWGLPAFRTIALLLAIERALFTPPSTLKDRTRMSHQVVVPRSIKDQALFLIVSVLGDITQFGFTKL